MKTSIVMALVLSLFFAMLNAHTIQQCEVVTVKAEHGCCMSERAEHEPAEKNAQCYCELVLSIAQPVHLDLGRDVAPMPDTYLFLTTLHTCTRISPLYEPPKNIA